MIIYIINLWIKVIINDESLMKIIINDASLMMNNEFLWKKFIEKQEKER